MSFSLPLNFLHHIGDAAAGSVHGDGLALLCAHVKTDAQPAKVQALIDLVEMRCPVGDSLNSGVPMEKAKIIMEY